MDFTPTKKRYYIGPMEFDANRNFVAANFADGRFYLAGEGNKQELVAEYQHKDHLGNVRVAFSDRNGDKRVQLLDGAAGPSEVTQINDYFPFGLQFPKACGAVVVPENRYQYNGKEWEEEFGLKDYGGRWYNPSIGRWTSVDPLTEFQGSWTPYHFNYNNALKYVDMNGLMPSEIQVCPSCPDDAAYDLYRDSPHQFYYDEETNSVFNLPVTTVSQKKRKGYDFIDRAEEHLNGWNDILIGAGLSGSQKWYNTPLNHRAVSKVYYDTYKALRAHLNLPKPGAMRQKLKRFFGTGKASGASTLARRAGILGVGMTLAKVGADVYSDGQISPSSVADGVLLIIAGGAAIFAGPVAAVGIGSAVMIYGIVDYTFQIGAKLDDNLPELTIYDP